jgi:hypothetical protein
VFAPSYSLFCYISSYTVVLSNCMKHTETSTVRFDSVCVAAFSADNPSISPTVAVEAYYEIANSLDLHALNFN